MKLFLSDATTAIAAAVEEQGAVTKEIARGVEVASQGTQAVTTRIHVVAGAIRSSSDTSGAAPRMSRRSPAIPRLSASKWKASSHRSTTGQQADNLKPSGARHIAGTARHVSL